MLRVANKFPNLKLKGVLPMNNNENKGIRLYIDASGEWKSKEITLENDPSIERIPLVPATRYKIGCRGGKFTWIDTQTGQQVA
jgi:hypothetical protein